MTGASLASYPSIQLSLLLAAFFIPEPKSKPPTAPPIPPKTPPTTPPTAPPTAVTHTGVNVHSLLAAYFISSTAQAELFAVSLESFSISIIFSPAGASSYAKSLYSSPTSFKIYPNYLKLFNRSFINSCLTSS